MRTRILLLPVILFFAGCDWVGLRGNGNTVTDQRTMGAFAEIDSRGAFEIEWRAGSPALSVTADENLLRYIETKIEDNTLRLRFQKNLRPTHGIKVLVSSATLTGAHVSGAVRLNAHAVSADKFYLQSTGASDIKIDGTVNELLALMTGASDLNAKALQAKTVEISSTGASSAEINVSDALKVSITGAGDITYLGTPAKIEKRITGAGSIRHRD